MRYTLLFVSLLVFCVAKSQTLLDSSSYQFFYPKSFHTFQKKSDKTTSAEIEIKPHLDVQAGASASSDFVSSAFALADVTLTKRNLKFSVTPYLGTSVLPEYMREFTDETGVISQTGLVNQNEDLTTIGNAELRLNWQVSKHFNAELGNGRNFWGNGYRSMVLGQDQAPYPYVKLTTKAWKFSYVNLFMKHQALVGEPGSFTKRSKYASFHAIDLDITEDLTFTVFESVIWQAKDTLSNRGFDVNYLNPVIFYRPVEFSQGSADNVLLGIGLRYLHERKHLFYSQLFLDEFLFDNVSASTGWWANKVGVQVGLRSQLTNNLTAYSEYNLARPFTYTHGSVLQNYGHMNQSLAHPLGTNFMEWSSGAEYKKEDLILNLRFNWAYYGRDRDGNNYGGNIFTSYRNPFRSFGNEIGQGNTHHSYITQLTASKKLSSKLWGIFSYNWRHVSSSFELKDQHVFQIGLSLNPHLMFSRNLQENQMRFSNDF